MTRVAGGAVCFRSAGTSGVQIKPQEIQHHVRNCQIMSLVVACEIMVHQAVLYRASICHVCERL